MHLDILRTRESVHRALQVDHFYYNLLAYSDDLILHCNQFKGGTSGPTYTQLGSSATTGRAGYHQSSGNYKYSSISLFDVNRLFCFQGLWHWQSPVVPPAEPSPSNGGPTGSGGAGGGVGVPTTSSASHPPQGSELVTDMLQMLDHSGASGFEDLNMFSSNFE